MLKAFLSTITFIVLCLLPFMGDADEEKLIFNPPGSFLGSPPVSQMDYLSGFLDALYYVEKKGVPNKEVVTCLFENESKEGIQVSLGLAAGEAVADALDHGKENFSVVGILIERIESDCFFLTKYKPQS